MAKTTQLTRDEMIDHLAQVLHGLQVPYGVSSELRRAAMYGTALEPLRVIYRDAPAVASVDDFKEYLRARLIPTYREFTREDEEDATRS